MTLISKEDAETLLQKSSKDSSMSFIIFNKAKSDWHYDRDIALYLLQQAIEKCLKALLIIENVSYKKSHDISYLLRCVKHQLPNIESIIKYADEINTWEASTRYCFYELEDESIFYAVAMDYCTLYKFVNSLLSN